MEAVYDRISRTELATKIAILLAVLAVIGIVYFFGYYKDIRDQRGQLESAIALAKKNKSEAQQRLERFQKLKKQVVRLKQLSKRLARSLPDEAIIPLGQIHEKAEAAGVQVANVERKAEETTSAYARIPIELQIRGSYHRVMEFFWKLGQMDRIIKIANIKIASPARKDGEVMVTVSCEAATFRYLSRRRRKRGK
jgi:type IV pilus assembly protein PilO